MANLEKTLRKENNLSEKQLTKENNLILTDMIVYLHSSNLCEYDIEIIRKELIGMALEAQLREEGLSTVVGEDYKAFCDELIKNGRKKTSYETVLEFLYVVVFGGGALFFYEIIKNIIMVVSKKGLTNSVLDLPISWGFVVSFVCAILFAYGIFTFVSKNSFELTDSKLHKFLFIVGFTIIFVGIGFSRYFFDRFILSTINILIPIAIWIVGFIVVKILSDKHLNDLARTH